MIEQKGAGFKWLSPFALWVNNMFSEEESFLSVRKHDWFMAELIYVTSLKRTYRAWEQSMYVRNVGEVAEILGEGRNGYEIEAAREMSACRLVTLKTISIMFSIPYQSVRRYAAKHQWRKKRAEFRYDIQKKVQERTRELLLATETQQS